MRSFYFTVLLSLSFVFSSFAQAPGGAFDMSWYWQLSIESLLTDQGAKIELANKDREIYLRLGSTHEKFDIFAPFIGRTQESDLLFITEDQEGNEFTEQMRHEHVDTRSHSDSWNFPDVRRWPKDHGVWTGQRELSISQSVGCTHISNALPSDKSINKVTSSNLVAQ